MILASIGTTDLYSGVINSEYDASQNSSLDALTNEELAAIDSQVLISGPSIDHYVDGRATCSFTAWDESGDLAFYERQHVHIEDLDGIVHFSGLLQSCQSIRLPGRTSKFHTIDAADFTSLLSWRVVDYAANDKLAGDAVREILAEYLAEEGVLEGYIEDGNLMAEIAIGNKSAEEGLKKLADACGFVCYLDYDLKLYFHSRTLYAADWSIYDGTDVLSESFQQTRKNDNYRNTEIVIGGYEETALQTESWVGDGATKTFPLAFPANRFSTVTVAASAKTIGQKGTDSGSYDCYYAVNSETLTFEVAPANGAAIEAEYYGLWKAKSKAEDLSAIAANATRQGVGSGKVEHITIDESLKSIDAAGEYASAKLSEYGVDGIQISYKTRREGLAAGTLQHIEYLGLDHDFLIAHVGEEHKEGDVEYSVEGCHGPVQEEWDLFLNSELQLIYTVREGVEDAVGVTKLYNFSHTFEDADRPNPFTPAPIGAGIAVSSDTWPCFAPTDRAEFLVFYREGVEVFRKQATSVLNEETGDIDMITFISPSEAVGVIDHVGFIAGDSASSAIGSGVEVYRPGFSKTKTPLESYQINFNLIEG